MKAEHPISPTRTIDIVEVSPRDGLQNEKTLLSIADKVELVLRAAASGARRIEAVSFVNPKAVPQMADAEAVLEAVAEPLAALAGPVVLSGLVLNRRGLDRAIRVGLKEINFVVVASETFNRRNQGASVAETLAQIAEAGAIARLEGVELTVTIAAAFGCPFEGEVPSRGVVDLALAASESGLKEIALADTIGVGDPLAVETLIGEVRSALPALPIRCHFHNTRNTGFANAYAAWRAGAAALDSSIGGVGGCPFAPAATGNIATEDLAYMLGRMGVQTGLRLDTLIDAASWLAARLDKPSAGALGRAGLFPPPSLAASDAGPETPQRVRA